MKPFFRTPARISALTSAAQSWVGTPFVPNACIKGGGVSCQMLAGAVYREAGFLHESFMIPEGPMDWAHASKESLIAAFIDSKSFWFEPVSYPIQPGDLIGFKIGGCVHHLGIALESTAFIHCMRGEGTQLRRWDDVTYLKRIERIWRPVEHE